MNGTIRKGDKVKFFNTGVVYDADEVATLLAAAPKTLVIVEHDMGVIFDLADKISVLVYGEIIESAPPEAVRASKAVQEAYLGTTLEEA